ncbi:MAG TPA: SBBP repeat-containing protein, partial [bacterium]|nr:SBBP repeat-containing protein [bacterium]
MRILIATPLLILMLAHSLPSHALSPINIPPNSGFIPNRGQVPADVLYYGAVPGGAVYLTRTAIILDTWQSQAMPHGELESSVRRTGHAVWIRFTGSNPATVLEDGSPLKSRVNLFLGKTASQWHTSIPLFARTTYRDLWPGVSLTLAPSANGIACTLNPGANLDLPRFTIDRGDGVVADAITVGELSALLTTGEPGPDVNHSNALLWSTYLGGSAEELGWSAAIDTFGNVIVVGLNTSTFFPTVPGSYDTEYSGLGDVFVSKLSADGSTLLWSTFLGGSSDFLDYGYAVKLDPENNPIVTGYTRSYDFPVTIDAFDTVYEDGEFGRTGSDVFVTKLDSDGRSLIFSTYLGDVGHDIGYDVDFDASGAVVVAGRTASENFPTTPGAFDTDPNGEEDGFITALSPDGETLIWSTLLGGSGYDGVQSIRLDGQASSLVCGYTGSLDFPHGLSANGLYDIFVAKVSSTGNTLEWSRLIGGSSYDYGTDLALDAHGNPVICGSTGSFDFPVTPGAYDEEYNGD